MPINTIVVDASPLIVLYKSGLIDILPRLFTDVLVPEAVWTEVTGGGSADAAANKLPVAEWARLTPVAVTDPTIVGWSLGAGESEVLSLAQVTPAAHAMLDDKAARACARTLKIPVLGTGAALVSAKRRGIIDSMSVALQQLADAGLWLSDDIMRLLREQAGE